MYATPRGGPGHPSQNGQGFSWDWVPGAAEWVWGQVNPDTGYVASGCFGGSYDYIRPYTEGACAGTPGYEAIARAVANAPQEDIDHIVRDLWATNNSGPSSRAELQDPACLPYWVKAFLGGRDCINKALPHNVPWFKEWVDTYGGIAPPATEPPPFWEQPGAAVTQRGNLLPLALAAAAFFVVPKIIGRGV